VSISGGIPDKQAFLSKNCSTCASHYKMGYHINSRDRLVQVINSEVEILPSMEMGEG